MITPGQVEKQTIGKGKQPVYERIVFRAAGRGDLSAVTGLMEEFHKTPPWNEWVIYELHVGTFNDPDPANDTEFRR